MHQLEVVRESGRPPHVESVVVVDGWRAAIRLALQRGRVVASDLRVTPATDELPQAGLTAKVLARIPVHAHMRAFAELMRRPLFFPSVLPWTRRRPGQLFVPRGSKASVSTGMLDIFAGTELEALATSPTRGPRRGRRPIAMETLLEVARAYAAAARADSPRPTQDAATKLGMTLARARDLVYRARHRGGLLTPATWGRPGGELTPQARGLLRRRPRKAASSQPRRRTR